MKMIFIAHVVLQVVFNGDPTQAVTSVIPIAIIADSTTKILVLEEIRHLKHWSH